MTRVLARALGAGLAALLLVAGTGTAAYADGVEDLLAQPSIESIVRDAAEDLPPVEIAWQHPDAEDLVAPTAGTVCFAPTADGRMVGPGVAAGAVPARAAISAEFHCLGTSPMYWPITATVTDYYLADGSYRAGRSFTASAATSTGTVAVAPAGVAEYSPTGPAVNTWHFVRVVATTPWGVTLYDSSELYYLTAV